MVALGACMHVALATRVASAQADALANPALGAAFRKLTTLELGQDLGAFHPIRQAVVQSRTDEKVRTDLEARLIVVLQGDATDLGKDYACRQLVLVGSDASLPVLAELLTNPRMSYMARFAMEGIGSPAAMKALREMLDKTAGRQKVGVVISLGRLADANATSAIAALLDAEDAELREVAVIALGRIGTVQAGEALQAFAGKAPETLQDTIIDAQLDATESLCRQGEHETAAAICESLLSADSERVKAAAFRGLISARPSKSLTMILDGLAANEAWKQAVAADCVVQLDESAEIRTITAGIPNLPAPGKIAAFLSLRSHRDPAIRAAALKSFEQSNDEVCRAALAALILSGTPEDVPTVADLATTAESSQIRNAALETLRLMPADGTNRAMVAWMEQAKNLEPKVVQCALARRSPEFVPAFLKAARSPNEVTRQEAFKALEIMATEKDAEALIDFLCKTSPGEEREAAGRAVWMSCQKIADPAQRSALLLAAMEKADAAGKCAILPSLARVGGEESLVAIRSAMGSSDQDLRDAGYRALANWPDATVAGELLEIVKSSKVESYRVWSLRAYARVVALPSERPAQETFEMLKEAMSLATRTEDKTLIVSRLGAVRAPDALALLLSFVDDPDLKEAAVPAVFTLAKGLSLSHPDQATAALKKIQPLTKDPATLQQIPKVLRDIEGRK
jgi:HEAT repeat protein